MRLLSNWQLVSEESDPLPWEDRYASFIRNSGLIITSPRSTHASFESGPVIEKPERSTERKIVPLPTISMRMDCTETTGDHADSLTTDLSPENPLKRLDSDVLSLESIRSVAPLSTLSTIRSPGPDNSLSLEALGSQGLSLDEIEAQIAQSDRSPVDKRRILSTLFILRAKSAPVNRLTDDALELVFAAGCYDKYSGMDRCFPADVVLSGDSSEQYSPFQITVSHVCRRWRLVSTSCAILWTDIRLHGRKSLKLAKYVLPRTKFAPLNIFVREVEYAPSLTWVSLLLFLRKTFFRISKLRILSCQHLLDYLMTNCRGTMPVLEEFILQKSETPCTELDHDLFPEDSDQSDSDQEESDLEESDFEWPRIESRCLRSVVLEEVYFPWNHLTLSGLSRLYIQFLEHGPRDTHPSKSSFIAMLQACPSLVYLEVTNLQFADAGAALAETPPIHLLRLEFFRFSQLHNAPRIDFETANENSPNDREWTDILILPSLHHLDVDLDDGTEETGVPFVSRANMYCLKSLRRLRLRSCTEQSIPIYLLAAPWLHTLILEMCVKELSVLQTLCQMDEDGPSLVPQLVGLGIWLLSDTGGGGSLSDSHPEERAWEAVGDVVSARRLAAQPLRMVCVGPESDPYENAERFSDDGVEVFTLMERCEFHRLRDEEGPFAADFVCSNIPTYPPDYRCPVSTFT